jgi:hypothetical protein
MCFTWWLCHEAAAVFKMAYTIEQRMILSEKSPMTGAPF